MKPTHKWIHFPHCYSHSKELLKRPYFSNQTKHSIKKHSVLYVTYIFSSRVPVWCHCLALPIICHRHATSCSLVWLIVMCIAADRALCSTHSKLDTSKGKSKSPLKADAAFQLQQRPELSWRSATFFGTVLCSRK